MELFAKGIIESVKATFYRWRRNGPQIANSPAQSYEFFGENVRISGDGTVVAIWIPSYNYGNSGVYNGAVKAYKINSNGSWTQRGNILLTDQVVVGGTRFGAGIALNFDGSKIAISAPWYNKPNTTGRVTVYEFTAGDWGLIGTFYGTESTSGEGTTLTNYGISFNAAGTRIAMFLGYVLGGGQVKIYDYTGTTWTQVGQTIVDSVDATLSASGDVLFTGSKTWSLQSGTWVQTGSFPLEFATIAGQTASLVTLGGAFNATGTRFTLRWKFNLITPWHVLRTYDFLNGTWNQVGTQHVYTTFAVYSYINGRVFEGSISQIINPELSGDGSRMILWGNHVKSGQIINAQNTSSAVTGRVMVFDFANGNWSQQAQVIYGNSLRSAADLSSDGKMIVYGLGNDRPRGLTTGSHGVTEVYRKELN